MNKKYVYVIRIKIYFVLVPAAVKPNTFQISFLSSGATYFNLKWTAPAFPGEDLKYQVTLRDQLKDVLLDTRETSSK